MTTTTFDRNLAELALDEAVELAEQDAGHVETFRHADGSATVIFRDMDPINPREDFDHFAVLVNLSRDYRDMDDDEAGIGDARDHFADHRDGEALVRRFVSINCPNVLHYCHEWEVSGYSQSDWQKGYGYVTREAMTRAGFTDEATMREDAERLFKGELAEWQAYFAGDVYQATHYSLGAPQVTYGAQGAYVSGYDVDEETVSGFLGYDKLSGIAANFTDSPVVP